MPAKIMEVWRSLWPTKPDVPAPVKAPEDKPKPGREFGATPRNSPLQQKGIAGWIGPLPNPNQVLTYERGKAGPGYKGSPIDLITECYNKDPYIRGLVLSRVENVLQMDAAINQYDASDDAVAASRLCDRVGEGLGGFHRLLEESLTNGIVYGLSLHELLWGIREFPLKMGDRPRVKQWIVPIAYRQVRPNRIAFDADGNIMIFGRFASPSDAAQCGYSPTADPNWWYPHPLNILMFSRYRDHDNPYGYPLLSSLFYISWFKRLQIKWWSQFNERNSDPLYTAEVDHEAEVGDEDLDNLQGTFETIQEQTGIVLPAGVHIEKYELTGSGAVNSFQQIIGTLQDMAAVLISGQTSTSSVPRQGSSAQADVHERNALAKYSADARSIESMMNEFFQLIVSLNFPPEASFKCPNLNVNTRSVAEVAKWAEVLNTGLQSGADIPMREFYRRTGIDSPLPGEPLLKQLPAPYAPGAAGGPPSQRTPAKTTARANQRAKAKPPASQAQPKKA